MKKTLQVIGAIIVSIIGGILGTLSGQGFPKFLRRICIPAMLALFAILCIKLSLISLALISIIAMWGPLSLGYGLPDSSDEGSFLGKIAVKLANGNKILEYLYTRGFIGFLEGLCLIAVPIIKNNWISYAIVAHFLIFINTFIPLMFENVKEIKLGKIQLLPSELVLYFLLSLSSCLLVIF